MAKDSGIERGGTELPNVIHHERENPEDGPDSMKENGLLCHQEIVKTPEEARAERRFVRKIDLHLLPLICIVYFLASLVSHATCLRRNEISANCSGRTEEIWVTRQWRE